MKREDLKKISIDWFNGLNRETQKTIKDVLGRLDLTPVDGVFALDYSRPGLNLHFWIEKEVKHCTGDYVEYVNLAFLDKELKEEEILEINEKVVVAYLG